MRNGNRYYLLFIVCLMSISGSVAARSYKIELIIFAQNTATSETFNEMTSHIKWPARVANLSDFNSATKSLNGHYAKLAASQKYQPLIHVAWTQNIGSNRVGRAVKISTPRGTINGFFQVQRGHLVHMKADFEYSAGGVIHRIHEKRRFKLKETHYFDHPKFGIIARVSPI